MSERERSRFHRIPWKIPPAQEVEEELDFHLEMRILELQRDGLAPELARENALARLGDRRALSRNLTEIARGRDRTMRRQDWLADFRQDLAFAWRQLAKTPGFSAVAVATLALGIGAAALIFSALYAVVLRPLPFADPERLVVMGTGWKERVGGVSAGNFLYFEERNRCFAGLAASYSMSFNLDALGTGPADVPERVIGLKVTHNFFSVLGSRTELGRPFLAEEDQPGREHVVLLSHRLWQRRFGGDRAILGRSIRLGGEPYQVVGVMPAEVDFRLDSAELWLPIAFTPERRQMHDEHFLGVYGRLAPGVSLAQAKDDLERVAVDLRRDHAAFYQDRFATVIPLLEVVVGNVSDRLWLLQSAVILLLLIACGNVAGLLLARGLSRSGELALRSALGSGRGRILRQLLSESLLLALLGAVAGLALAAAGLELFKALAPAGIPRLAEARLDLPTLAFGAVAALVSCLLSGLAPALELSRVDLAGGLRSSGRGAGGPQRGHRLRRALVAAEVGLAVLLLTGSGLLVRTAIHLARVAPGFESEGLLTARLALPAARYSGHQAPFAAFESIVRGLAESPGVARAAAASQPPLVGGGTNGLFRAGVPPEPRNLIDSRSQFVTAGYFETLQVPLVQGRTFTAQDSRDAPRVMILNETLARALFPSENPLGQRVSCCEGGPEDPRYKEVVGVVADTRSFGPGQEVEPEFFLPLAQVPEVAWDWIQRTMVLVARSEGAPAETLSQAVRQAVRSTDPGLPIYDLATMKARYERNTAPARFNTVLFSGFGLAGLLLAVIGLYGVIAYAVTERRREIGVRIALGATPGEVRRFVFQQGLGPVLVGLVVGVMVALAAGRAIKTLLFGVAPADPLTLAAVLALLAASALAACLGPACRATRIDPATTLKEG